MVKFNRGEFLVPIKHETDKEGKKMVVKPMSGKEAKKSTEGQAIKRIFGLDKGKM